MVNAKRIGRTGWLLGAALAASASVPAKAEAATTCASSSPGKCVVGTGALHAKIDKALGEVIDSGWMEKGPVKVRARFAVAPVGREPVFSMEMARGALVEASWEEKGFVDLKPIVGEGSGGTMNVRYTLAPTIDAGIYGVTISKNASELVNMVPGAAFNYDVKASGPVAPWGFDGGQVQMPSPSLDSSTLFALPFSSLGVSTGTAEGTLSLQATTKPTFSYRAKEVRFGPETVKDKSGKARILAGDVDALDLQVSVRGEVSYSGTLDVRPVVKVDEVGGVSTFGLVKVSFSTVTKSYSGAPIAVATDAVTLHVPLPNVKVPSAGIDIGSVKVGGRAEKSVTVTNTGELAGVITLKSSDPRFQVPSEPITIGPKSSVPVKVAFAPNDGSAASATITVASNDPDAPEQTFRIGANGAEVSTEPTDDASGRGGEGTFDPSRTTQTSSGCSTAPARSTSGTSWSAILVLGAFAGAIVRRGRRS